MSEGSARVIGMTMFPKTEAALASCGLGSIVRSFRNFFYQFI